MPERRERRLSNPFNQWFITRNIHIWLGIITTIIGFALYNNGQEQSERAEALAAQVKLLKNENASLRTTLAEKEKACALRPIIEPVKINTVLDKNTSEAKVKIEKVQNVLMQSQAKNNEPKVKSSTNNSTSTSDADIQRLLNRSYCEAKPGSSGCPK